MCTITLEYNQHNALARKKLAALLATGLFQQKEMQIGQQLMSQEAEEHRIEKEAFLAHSKKTMSNVIARYL